LPSAQRSPSVGGFIAAAQAFSRAPPDAIGSNLLDPRTTALDQNDQNDDNQYTGNYPDQHCGVHKFPLPQLVLRSGFLSSRFSTRFEPLNRNPDS